MSCLLAMLQHVDAFLIDGELKLQNMVRVGAFKAKLSWKHIDNKKLLCDDMPTVGLLHRTNKLWAKNKVTIFDPLEMQHCK